ncbi:hypothetical protein GRF61_22695 [Azoarcus sp. TTM-91]|uniref:hypothetical protein n=1 Tax=Azoarcus sp. TTM-91 TaxID=2691581 RepID=UPI00145D9135|nr:hypothetical protein [Azoarcus sp. TTM-91]NMG37271.1 hypothetical protein [Azoarcus sp. TTM-91]
MKWRKNMRLFLPRAFMMLRGIALLALLTSLIATSMAVVAGFNRSYLFPPSTGMVDFLAQNYIDRSRFDSQQLGKLDSILRRMKGGEPYLERLQEQSRKWSVIGFGVLAVLSLSSAVLSYRVSRRLGAVMAKEQAAAQEKRNSPPPA